VLPRLIQIGPFPLYSFGLMVVLGFIAGVWLATRLAMRRGLPGAVLMDAAVVILLAGIVGARLLFVLLNWKTFAAQPWDVFSTWQGGMSFHGGAAAGIFAGVLYARAQSAPVLRLAEAAVPGLALGYAVGRIGCFLNGCCYGEPTTLPWGIPGAYCQGVRDAALHYHPAQLYAMLLNLVLCAALVRAYHRPHHVGQVMALYVGGYSVYRFAIEALRKNYTADVAAFGLTASQLFSIAAIVVSAAWWLWLKRHSESVPEVAQDNDASPEPAVAAPSALPPTPNA